MKILITGGAGFLGSHLSDKLLSLGHTVVCLDNFFTGSKKNINHLRADKRFKLIRHDIVNPIRLDVDRIYNLACPASPIQYQYNPIKTIQCSTVGMVNMLELAKRCGARILQASTSEVYGDPEVHPQKESYWGHVNPIGPRACYDEGKRVAETLCMGYHHQNKVDVRIARIFNTYGPRMSPDDGRVVSNFMVQALANKPITIYGRGQQTRSFCYVVDLIEGLVALMESDYVGPVNLGNPQEISVTDLAQRIIRLTRSKSNIIHKPLPKDDPRQRQPDIRLAKRVLQWKPRVTLTEGLKNTLRYFSE